MKINCLSCGLKMDLSDAYDNYEGQVKCYACGATLEIKTEEGDVRAVKPVGATLEIETEEGNVRAVKPVGAILEIKTEEDNVRAVKPVGAILEIKTEEGKIRAVKSVKIVPSHPAKSRRGHSGRAGL